MSTAPTFQDMLRSARKLSEEGVLKPGTIERCQGSQSRLGKWCSQQQPPIIALPITADALLLYATARLEGTWIPKGGTKLLGRSMEVEAQGIRNTHLAEGHPDSMSDALRCVIDGAKENDPDLKRQPAFTGVELHDGLGAAPPTGRAGHAARLAVIALVGETGSVRSTTRALCNMTVHDAQPYELALQQRWRMHATTHEGAVVAVPFDDTMLRTGARPSQDMLFLCSRRGEGAARPWTAWRLELHLEALLRRARLDVSLGEIATLDPPQLNRLLTWADLGQVRFTRDRALVLACIGAGFTGSEPGVLRWDAVSNDEPDVLAGWLGPARLGADPDWTLMSSSTSALCPVAAWRRWQFLCGPLSAWVFPGIGAKGNVHASGLTCGGVRGVMKRLGSGQFEPRASHALRRTTAAMLVQQNIAPVRIAKKLRHRSQDSTESFLSGDNDGTAARGVQL